jgi:hypothetical protein
MQKFQLELFFQIIGIGSASGLWFDGDSLFLISDNSNVLYDYRMEDKSLEKIALTEGSLSQLENIVKADKPDFEAMTVRDGILYLFGSGSTEKRNTILPIDKISKKPSTPIDATDLYIIMQDFGQINQENFNIEAAVNDGDTWYLFNRGNGPSGQNGIYTLNGTIKTTEFQIIYNEIKLPKIGKAPSSFTDAIKVGNKIYFLAAAEAGNSTYHDGEIAGSILGRIDIETMEIEMTETISLKNKFEGLTLYKDDGKTLQFLLCEDTDSDNDVSDIYKLTIKK